jgi:hypothetical protein
VHCAQLESHEALNFFVFKHVASAEAFIFLRHMLQERFRSMRLPYPLTAAFILFTGTAFAADMDYAAPQASATYERAVIQSNVPACDNHFILRDIQRRFAQKERQYWHSDLSIASYQNAHMTAYRPWGAHMIERIFCKADVVLSNHQPSVVHYSIGRRTGFAGTNYGIDFCVEGADRNMAYAPHCKMAQP